MPAVRPYYYVADGEKVPIPYTSSNFLQTESQNTLTRLYQRPSSRLSIFRIGWSNVVKPLTCVNSLLAPLERQIIMNLLWLERIC
ncbi:LOW QUALITY PROTEIN: hypothetical protein CVT25_000573 [Psilocybe cyanescens]|uniref:Uncharacterized protein n=1 Tax=Psilocybe cyanescens TaxID=93625 RepID=A0A409WZV3_PSICY|nr:LOW QUALITY PROTEIN: hypothetical protein CVT25_000573 [Psilocybe cyanescens]